MNQIKWIKESINDVAVESVYEIGNEIGRGSSSVIYSCVHKSTGYEYAVKVIPKKENRQVFASREIGILFKLKHQNIIRLLEIYENDFDIYMILELARGGELFDRILENGSYSEKDAAKCICQIVEGLAYIHAEGVIHRDLKPENLLYLNAQNAADNKEESTIKISDFGLSKIMDNEIMAQTVCTSPEYCAPEVLLGIRYDTSADMWSVGVITYILLCGYYPFFGSNDTAMFRTILTGTFEFHTPWWDEVSHNAKNFIRKLLVLEPEKRYTAKQALQHPWLRGVAAKSDLLQFAPVNMVKFNEKRRVLKTIGMVAAITNKMANLIKIKSPEPAAQLFPPELPAPRDTQPLDTQPLVTQQQQQERTELETNEESVGGDAPDLSDDFY